MRLHAVTGTTIARLSPSSLAYDALAAGYDEQVRGDDWMRRALHAHYLRVFKAGERVLDVGCGTGIDALALAGAGIRVFGIDSSSEMIAQLRSKVAAVGLADRVEARVLRIEDLAAMNGERFDGLISAFASLSTLPDLARFADDASRLVRPHGRMVLHMLNRFSLWEWLGYLARRDFPAARRVGHVRHREFTIGGQVVPHMLYFPDEAYRRFFAGRFSCRTRYGMGSLRPPHTVRRLPVSLVSGLERLDLRAGGWPLVRNAGRFFVLDLERLPS